MSQPSFKMASPEEYGQAVEHSYLPDSGSTGVLGYIIFSFE